jgi:predicted dehydrogenase
MQSETTTSEGRPLRLGMMGLGFSHPTTFAKLLRDNTLQPAEGKSATWRQAHVEYIWDYQPERAQAFASEYGAQVVSSPKEILDAGVDAIMVETYNGEHAEYALPFLEAGVPTFIDKPICTTPEDLRRILNAAKRHGTKLMSCSSLRFHPAAGTLRSLIANGDLGTLLAVRATASHSIRNYMNEPNTWQDDIPMGGGTIVNMGIHGMEPLVAILGPDLVSATCIADKRHFTTSRSEDTALITLRWRNGVMATLEIYSGAPVGGVGFAAYGSGGIAEVVGSDLRRWGSKDAPQPLPAARGYAPMLEAFFDLVRDGTISVPLADTEAVALGLFAARRAAQERREVALAELR